MTRQTGPFVALSTPPADARGGESDRGMRSACDV